MLKLPMNDFVTIATYDSYIDANFDKHKLEERGILCYLADENAVVNQWVLSNAIGGIKLRVPGNNAQNALTVLEEKMASIPADFLIEPNEPTRDCPKCSSNNTTTEKYSKTIAGFSWLLLGFPVPARLHNSHRCFYCGHVWKTKIRS